MKNLFFIVCFGLGIARAEITYINLGETMKSAQFIGSVIIHRYNEHHVYFSSTEFKDSINSCKMASPKFSNQFIDYNTPYNWCEYWPNPNDTILVVIDQYGFFALCAKLIGDNYRFWYPYASFTGSGAAFEIRAPAFDLSGEKYEWGMSGDGCWLHKDYIRTYGRQ